MDLNLVCARIPVHIIFGAINDFLWAKFPCKYRYEIANCTLKRSREVHDAVTDPKSGRRFASISRIQGVGHLVSIKLYHTRCRLNLVAGPTAVS